MKDKIKVINKLRNERTELITKLNKLESFIINSSEEITFDQFNLLIEQSIILSNYIKVLSSRIKDLIQQIFD